MTRVNADLANNLGNLISRVLAMQKKYFDGVVQPLGPVWAREDEELKETFLKAEKDLNRHMEDLYFHRALEVVWGAIDHANRYIVQTSPFVLFKDPRKRGRVGEILHHLLETIRTVGRLLSPFIPETAKEIQALLNMSDEDLHRPSPWGEFFTAGHKIKPPKVLFPRIELSD